MGFRAYCAVFVFFAASISGAGQTIATVLGSAPDGVPAQAAELSTPGAVIVDGSGTAYVSLRVARQVVRIDTQGMVWVVAGNGAQGSAGDEGPAKSASLVQPAGLALDGAGNLYIADAGGNRIRYVGPDGTIHAFAGTGKSGSSGNGGPAAAATLNAPSAIVFDAHGNLLIADTGNHEIRMVSPDGTISLVAGIAKSGFGGDGDVAIGAVFNSPAGLAVDQAGDIYISDTGNQRVRIITPDGNINTFAGRGTAGYYGDGRDATSAELSNPTGLALDSAGNLYIADIGNVRVRCVTTDGKMSSYAGTGTRGSEGDGGWARSANLNLLGIGFDAGNNLWIADGSNNRVRVVTASNGIINTVAGTGLVAHDPVGVTIKGNAVFFSNSNTHRIMQLDLASKNLSVLAGTGASGYSGDSGQALAATMNTPNGLAFDAAGNLYIADTQNNRIRKIATDGTMSTFAGTGTADSTGDGAAATSAALHEPMDVAVDAQNNIYVLERTGNRLRKITPDGNINTIAGNGYAGIPGSETGVALSQSLNYPQRLALDASGGVLIADTSNHRVRRWTPDGTITTVAGTGRAGFGGDGGPATSAMLWNPIGVAADAAGNIYIADSNNNAVRRVGADGIITTIAGLAATSTGTPAGGYNGDGTPATVYELYKPNGIAAAPACSLLVADTSNQRLRQLWPAADYTISSDPAGLQMLVDGQLLTSPITQSWLPGTSHRIEGPASQDGPAGTRYVSPAPQDVTPSCGPARAAVTLSFGTQYSLAVAANDGGVVSPVANWQDAGASVTLTATPNAGFAFGGWQGDCGGTGACQLKMDGPHSVTATFVPAQ